MPSPAELFALPQVQHLITQRARRTTRHRLFSAADLDDVQQDLALHLYKKLANYDAARGDLPGYVFAVLRNHARTLVRARRAASARHSQHQHLCVDAVPEPAADRRLPGRGRHDSRSAVELRLSLDELSAGLPPQEQALVEGLLDQRSVAEVARAAGISRAAVYAALKRWLRRARELGLGDTA